jgi:hypothetical protein
MGILNISNRVPNHDDTLSLEVWDALLAPWIRFPR